jgi:hypothetical protein
MQACADKPSAPRHQLPNNNRPRLSMQTKCMRIRHMHTVSSAGGTRATGTAIMRAQGMRHCTPPPMRAFQVEHIACALFVLGQLRCMLSPCQDCTQLQLPAPCRPHFDVHSNGHPPRPVASSLQALLLPPHLPCSYQAAAVCSCSCLSPVSCAHTNSATS